MIYNDLKGKTAIVTGAGKKTGIGYAIAEKLAASGCNIIIADLGKPPVQGESLKSATGEEMETIAAELAKTHGVRTLAVAVDITDNKAIGAMVDAAIVVVEQAHKKLEAWECTGRRGDYKEVVISAVKEVGGTSFFALLVIAVSFIPVFALEAQEGRLFKPLAYTKTLGMIVAAVLTIIGYSMNDTVVVFDRIREDAAKYRDRKFDRIVNEAVNETLSRTILTSATVFFVTLAMNIFGTGVIRDFAFAMNVVVIVGSYSTIFIANPTLIWLDSKFTALQKRRAARPERNVRKPVRRDEEEPVET